MHESWAWKEDMTLNQGETTRTTKRGQMKRWLWGKVGSQGGLLSPRFKRTHEARFRDHHSQKEERRVRRKGSIRGAWDDQTQALAGGSRPVNHS